MWVNKSTLVETISRTNIELKGSGVVSVVFSNNKLHNVEDSLHQGSLSLFFDAVKFYETCIFFFSFTRLFRIIKTLGVGKTFEELDEKNTRRLTQEAIYQLLKGLPSFGIAILKREKSNIPSSLFTSDDWETLIKNQDKTLEFLEFVRHFGYSPKSACFPNAKISPPKKGDDNFRLCSKKLNCASDILVDSVRAKLDPYHTGFVSKEEFKDILTELCVQLNAYECDMLEIQFEKKMEANDICTAERCGGMAAVLQHSHRDASEPPAGNHTSGLDTLTTRLRNKLQGEWKESLETLQPHSG
ncbi:hypothetical protein HHUSO_G2620 [Huso huso]|uniref:EF-hand domain-containing protein n=1 Tax=Huso huso TaxID=61971 RepID=A0ABR1A8B0_HUSHU